MSKTLRLPSKEVQETMKNAKTWSEFTVPRLADAVWSGCKVYSAEHSKDVLLKLLDTNAGIDWVVEHNDLLYPLSVRVQRKSYYDFAQQNYGCATFTVRYQRIGESYCVESELGKAFNALENNALTAQYQLHAYVDSNDSKVLPTKVLAWSIAHRIGLFRQAKMLSNNPRYLKETEDKQRGQKQGFIVVPFDDLPKDIVVGMNDYEKTKQLFKAA